MSSKKDSFRIFFCRSENDLNVFLPLVKLAENNSIIIFYEDKFVPKDCTKTLIDSLSTKKFHFNFNIIEKLININSKIIKKIFRNKLISESINSYQRKIYRKRLSNKVNKIIDTINHEKITLIFEHNHRLICKFLIEEAKNKFGKMIFSLSVSQGEMPMRNYMMNIFEYKPFIADYSFYDLVTCNSKEQFRLFKGNYKQIRNLSSTKEWLKTLYGKSLVKPENRINSANPKFLLLHSNSVSSINLNEYKRVYKIFKNSKYNNFQIRPHPKDVIRELKFVKNKDDICKEGELIKSIQKNDVIIAVQTQAIYDALLMKKKVIVLTYMTSNILAKELDEFCTIIRSPEELYNLLNLNDKNTIWEILNKANNKYHNNYDFLKLKNEWNKLLRN